jgi:predicted RNA binding protein YcfA (HicA-like mRNA interferase family)
MSDKLPRITGMEAVDAFRKDGYFVDRIKGSHHILKHPQRKERLSIPVHKGATIGIGLLKKQIKISGMTVDEFCKLL